MWDFGVNLQYLQRRDNLECIFFFIVHLTKSNRPSKILYKSKEQEEHPGKYLKLRAYRVQYQAVKSSQKAGISSFEMATR